MAHMPSAPCPRVRSFTLQGGLGVRGGGRSRADPGFSSDPLDPPVGAEGDEGTVGVGD